MANNVVPFSRRVSPIEFNTAVNSKERMLRVCEGIAELIHTDDYFPYTKFQLGLPSRNENVIDIVDIPLDNRSRGYAVSTAFPQALIARFPREKSIDMAADYLMSYAIICGALKKAVRRGDTLRVETPDEPLMAEVWPVMPAGEDSINKFVLPFRAAGCLTLHLAGAKPFQLKDFDKPLPLPLAGLADPLTPIEFGYLNNVLQYT